MSAELEGKVVERVAQQWATRMIFPNVLYTVEEVAALLQLGRVKSVYEIPEQELRRTRVGPRRGCVRVLGADLLAYLAGRDPGELRVA